MVVEVIEFVVLGKIGVCVVGASGTTMTLFLVVVAAIDFTVIFYE